MKPLIWFFPFITALAACSTYSPSMYVVELDHPEAVVFPDDEPAETVLAALSDAERPEIADAADFGYNPADATDALQAAIDSGARVVIVRETGSPWNIGPVRLRSDQEIVFERGVIVQAKKGEFRNRSVSLFTMDHAQNVTLRGYGAVLRMRKADYRNPPYERAEWRHAVSIRSGKNVSVLGLRIESSGGDGIYIGRSKQAGAESYSEDIVIRDVQLLDHHRQGISVVSAQNLLIENAVIAGTRGTAPQAGIDFEPNQAYERLVNITVRDTLIERNAGFGFQVYLKNLDESSLPVSIRAEGNTIRRNFLPLWVANAGGSPRGEVTFRGNSMGWLRVVKPGPDLEVSYD